MPSIRFVSVEADPIRWPRHMGDLRAEPDRLVFLDDLARVGLVRSYSTAARLPKPINACGRPAWTGGTILRWCGAETACLEDQSSATNTATQAG